MNLSQLTFSRSLDENIATMKQIFEGDNTFICRVVRGRGEPSLRCALFFFDGMVQSESINTALVRPITRWEGGPLPIEELVERVIQIDDCPVDPGTDKLFGAFLYGDTIVFVDGDDRPAVVNTKGFDKRSTEEPDNEKVLRGPREGFTEAFMGNLALIRRRLRTPDLKFTFLELGTVSRTTAVLCYLDGIADTRVLHELQYRLQHINLDAILDANYLAECIRDDRFSPFPTVGMTERPDIAAAKLLEGRVALVVDGTPVVLTLPQILHETFQTNDDYYVSYLYMNLSRLLRVFGFFLTVTLPGLYLALIVYHPEMIPTRLLYSISAARQDIPFSTLTEAIGTILVFEILKEAGTRTPDTVGQALSIVGGLVLGQAAVEARLVSAPMVIIVAFSGVTAMIVPKLRTPALLLRFFLLGCAAVFGVYGILLGWALIAAHLCRLQSMGIPYLTNLIAREKHSGRDVLLRFPWFAMKPSHRFLAGWRRDGGAV
ncbi:MAG: spore germination protein [Eubacteriales bacterium]|nr:spore germination protein [Eubacteriales bacterium]